VRGTPCCGLQPWPLIPRAKRRGREVCHPREISPPVLNGQPTPESYSTFFERRAVSGWHPIRIPFPPDEPSAERCHPSPPHPPPTQAPSRPPVVDPLTLQSVGAFSPPPLSRSRAQTTAMGRPSTDGGKGKGKGKGKGFGGGGKGKGKGGGGGYFEDPPENLKSMPPTPWVVTGGCQDLPPPQNPSVSTLRDLQMWSTSSHSQTCCW